MKLNPNSLEFNLARLRRRARWTNLAQHRRPDASLTAWVLKEHALEHA
jgi:hypothetical protein